MPFVARNLFVCALGLTLAGTGCGRDLFLSVSSLEIGPNPAQPGDTLVASFNLALSPVERHTIILFIESTEHLRVTSSSTPSIPVVLEIGDAGDLIDAYGVGTHTAHVEVQLPDRGKSARSGSTSFELQAVP